MDKKKRETYGGKSRRERRSREGTAGLEAKKRSFRRNGEKEKRKWNMDSRRVRTTATFVAWFMRIYDQAKAGALLS